VTTRRDFLHTTGVGLLASRLRLPTPGASASFSLWTWVHGGGDLDLAAWRQRYDRLRDAGFTGVVVGGGDPAMHAEAAHGAGLVLHRWTWAMNRSGDAKVKAEHPEWFAVSREGKSSLTSPPYVGYYQWLCPTRPAVRAYLADRIDEVAATPGVDAVHLDYIRLPDVILPRNLWEQYGLVQDHEMAPYDFCYCEACRARFEAESGRDPLALADPAADEEWRHYRWRIITEVVTDLARAVHARGKAISAAVFPTPTIARRLVRQAWDRWPLDVVFPMLYQSFYREDIAWIGRGVREGVAALPADVPLVAGLYLPDLPPDQLALAIRTARDAGAAGACLFEMNGITDERLAALKG
jgi:uncharacterized lipoprotein YddW (UPF0748 family)